jgi:glycosyltransferase involved in cell wall biosynthesis
MRPLFFPLTLIDGFAAVARTRDDVGLVICGVSGHMEEDLWLDVQGRIRDHALSERICIIEDLNHDAFLTALSRAALYLRTPITDGVAASVLEALALGIPVVACENGTRPAGVITYPAEDHQEMAARVAHVLAHRDRIVRGLAPTAVPDTVADELALLTSQT